MDDIDELMKQYSTEMSACTQLRFQSSKSNKEYQLLHEIGKGARSIVYKV